MTANAFLALVRSWIGVPYLHGQCVREGCDCGGLLIGALREAGLGDWSALLACAPRSVPAGYLRERLATIGFRRLRKGARWRSGDVLLFEIGGNEQHIAVYAGEGQVIHVLQTTNGVVEQPLAENWARHVSAVYRLPSLED